MNSLLCWFHLSLFWCLVAAFAVDWKESSLRDKRADFAFMGQVALGDFPDNKANGEPCKFNHHCVSGCCLVLSNDERICSRLSRKRQRCETGQVKGGAYPYFCPCVANAICKESRNGTQHMFCV